MENVMPYKNKKGRALNSKNKAQTERQRLRGLAEIAGVTLHAYRKQIQPMYYGLHCLLVHRRRWARKSNIPFLIKRAYLASLFVKQKGLCPLTKQPLRLGVGTTMHNASIDRKNPKFGYIEGNVRLVCFWANIARYNLTDTQFKAWCKRVTS